MPETTLRWGDRGWGGGWGGGVLFSLVWVRQMFGSGLLDVEG